MKRFTRTKEDFVCERCGVFVQGNGYTNHCPECLWSKHVDISPGDRSAVCGGMMEPVRLLITGQSTDIVHKCSQCGLEKKNKASQSDNSRALLILSTKVI